MSQIQYFCIICFMCTFIHAPVNPASPSTHRAGMLCYQRLTGFWHVVFLSLCGQNSAITNILIIADRVKYWRKQNKQAIVPGHLKNERGKASTLQCLRTRAACSHCRVAWYLQEYFSLTFSWDARSLLKSAQRTRSAVSALLFHEYYYWRWKYSSRRLVLWSLLWQISNPVTNFDWCFANTVRIKCITNKELTLFR